MAVRANGDRVRWRIRAIVCQLSEMMDFQKREAVSPDKRSGLVTSLACSIRTFKHPSFDLSVSDETGRCRCRPFRRFASIGTFFQRPADLGHGDGFGRPR